MVQLGKVYSNLMVDLRATNQKLWDRGARIIATVTGLDRDEAWQLLRRADGHVKAAVVMHARRVELADARQLLERAGGSLRQAISG
jgi:N-acetylmuramic acid 6-phosphate etherase